MINGVVDVSAKIHEIMGQCAKCLVLKNAPYCLDGKCTEELGLLHEVVQKESVASYLFRVHRGDVVASYIAGSFAMIQALAHEEELDILFADADEDVKAQCFGWYIELLV